MNKIAIVLISLTSTIVIAQKSLIKNGDFEAQLTNWRGDVATISPFEKMNGKGSCIISQFTGAEWKGIDQIASIPKNTYALEVSAWIKTDAIERGKEVYNAGIVNLEFMTIGETNVGYESIAQITGSSPWTLYKKLIVVPEKAKKIRIMLALAQTNGFILFDAVKVVTVSKETYLETSKREQLPLETVSEITKNSAPKVFLNGNFEKGLDSWIGYGKVAPYKAKEGDYCAIIHSKENKWVDISQQADINEGVKKIKFSGWLKAQDIIQGAEFWNNGLFIVEFTTDGTTKTTEDQVIGNTTGTTDWAFFEQTLDVPEGTKKYRIILALSNCTGTLLADDIQPIIPTE